MAEPLKATFFAFQKRGQSGVLLRSTLVFAGLALVLIGGFVAMFWSSVGPLLNWYADLAEASARNDTDAVQALGFPAALWPFLGALMLWLFPFYILCAAYEAACLRWLTRGETSGPLGLSFGADTWRVWSVYWIWFLLNMAFSIVMGILVAVLTGALLVSTGGDTGAATAAMPLIYIVQYGLMAYFAVRLAPAAAVTIARRKFAFFDAWQITKGRFLPLLGSFAVVYASYALVTIILGVVWLFGVLGGAGVDWSANLADPQQQTEAFTQALRASIAAFSQPQTWIIAAVSQIISWIAALFYYLASFGINARATLAALEEGKIKPAV